jgi:L-ascorbate metabolism protein UlaG (beta-lactamase superfamily)
MKITHFGHACVLVTDRDTAAKLDGALTVEPGDRVDLDGATVDVVGGAHEPVYRAIPDCTNAAYLVNAGEFYHPGDSFFAPETTTVVQLELGVATDLQT